MKIGLQLQQKQSLIMTQRLQQALKLLQVPTLELQQILQQELQQNPLLEEVSDFEEVEETPESPEESSETSQEESETASPETSSETSNAEDETREGEKSLEEWEEYWQEASFDHSFTRGEVMSAEDFYEKVPTTSMTLADHVTQQLHESTDDDALIAIGDYLIGSIDERGFLTMSSEEVAEVLDVPVEAVDEAVVLLQSFEPPGVAAHDLRECLLIQLRGRGEGGTLPYRIVEEQFENLKEKRYNEIGKALHITVGEVQEAADVIATLNPRPGNEITSDEIKYVIPDLVVERVDDDYVVYLNDRNVPRLRISNAYRHILSDRRGRKGDETQKYIVGKLNSARWLIQTIEQRRKTMVKVMQSIVEKQRDFFERGISQLRPLTLQQVATEIGMHESTVSRVTTNKYVQTPRGVFELKFFFSSGLETEDGEEMSAKSAKGQIRELIDGEDKKDPLSDQRIADILHGRGLKIARRTVAKYREQLNIMPARFRKRH
ncbi:MAG: RNA polymerase factor sigma-54 [Candidatus Eiseniibacteriota bacterium]|jgi:RNA polymerase sigma-54 factor